MANFIDKSDGTVNYCNSEGSEDVFIGWKSSDGLLEVVSIHGKQKSHKLYKVICHKCKQDKELFPNGYFVSLKGHLQAGKKPCGCSKIPKWNKDQFLVLARRAAKDRFTVHGFNEEFHGRNTKLNLECLKDGHKWTASIGSVINQKNGCPKCASKTKGDSRRLDEQEVLCNCVSSCETEGYEPIGFPAGYKNAKSRFEYKCPKHGIQNVSYDAFINGKRRCPSCARNGYRTNRKGSFYVVRWSLEDNTFIKFGITNRDVIKRIKEQGSSTKYKYEILFSTSWEDGKIALSIENNIKGSGLFTFSVIDKKYFMEGFTETISEDSLYLLEEVIIESILKLNNKRND